MATCMLHRFWWTFSTPWQYGEMSTLSILPVCVQASIWMPSSCSVSPPRTIQILRFWFATNPFKKTTHVSGQGDVHERFFFKKNPLDFPAVPKGSQLVTLWHARRQSYAPTPGTKEGNVEMAVRQALLSAKSYTASIPAYDFLVSACIYAVEFLVVHGHSTDLQFKRLRSWEAGGFKNYYHEIVKKPQ